MRNDADEHTLLFYPSLTSLLWMGRKFSFLDALARNSTRLLQPSTRHPKVQGLDPKPRDQRIYSTESSYGDVHYRTVYARWSVEKKTHKIAE